MLVEKVAGLDNNSMFTVLVLQLVAASDETWTIQVQLELEGLDRRDFTGDSSDSTHRYDNSEYIQVLKANSQLIQSK